MIAMGSSILAFLPGSSLRDLLVAPRLAASLIPVRLKLIQVIAVLLQNVLVELVELGDRRDVPTLN